MHVTAEYHHGQINLFSASTLACNFYNQNNRYWPLFLGKKFDFRAIYLRMCPK